MLREGDRLDAHETLGAITTVRRMPSDPTSDPFETETVIAPHRRALPRHVHPHQSDAFEVLEGELSVWLAGRWYELAPGEKTEAAPGVVHTVANRSGGPVRFRNTHTPAMAFPEILEGIYRLAGSGGRVLDLALLLDSYPEDIRLASSVGRVGTEGLAAVARRLGRRSAASAG